MNILTRVSGAITLTVLSGLSMAIVAAQGTPNERALQKRSDTMQVRCVDGERRPVGGAQLGRFVSGSSESDPTWRYHDANGTEMVTDTNGVAELRLNAELRLVVSGMLYARQEQLHLVGWLEFSPGDFGQTRELVLQPECHVRGRLRSSGLTELGRPMKWSNVYLYNGNHRPLSYSSEQQRFEFFVPPGQYKLDAYGDGLEHQEPPFAVRPGQRELELELDLRPTRLAWLIGKPAPELSQIKGWKNGNPIRLADLRGQYILLDFWGYWCSPCVQKMPGLMDLHDAFGKHGLVIIAVHDDSVASVAEMDAKLAQSREKYWGGRDLPFLTVLDGGGQTPIEGSQHTVSGATTAAYGIQAFPTQVLIGPDGKVMEEFKYSDYDGAVTRLETLLRTKLSPAPWKARFQARYRLSRGENLKRIAPPFIPERLEYYRSEFRQQSQAIADPPNYFTFHWDHKLSCAGYGHVGADRTLSDVLRESLNLRSGEFAVPEAMCNLRVPGDWIVRTNADKAALLHAFASILGDELKVPIQFETQSTERDVIVVSGHYEHHPLPDYPKSAAVHFYVEQLNEPGSGGGGSGTMGEMLAQLENLIHERVINEVQVPEGTILVWRHGRASQFENLQKDPARVDLLLENLSRQTSLQFRKEKRKMDIWTLGSLNPR